MPSLPDDIAPVVAQSLAEDLGSGDLTAELINPDAMIRAMVVSRDEAILCGAAWFDEVYKQLKNKSGNSINIVWDASDSEDIHPEQVICKLSGSARTILTGERTALNFLQTLSGTATSTNKLVKMLDGLDTKILDTRKTLPGLRKAQKYAVLCGGGQNHRQGLYDAILIKENHIAVAGGIADALKATEQFSVPVEIEVENLQQLEEALNAGANNILLDNFNLDALQKAVSLNQGRARLEASGGIEASTLRSIAETGVDYISIGALTKHLTAVDFSMRIENQ